MKKIFFLFCFLMLPVLLTAQTTDFKSLSDEWISQLTLEEKAKLVVGMGMRFPGMPRNDAPVVGQVTDKVAGAAGSTFAVPHLSIPGMVVADGPAGLRISPVRNQDSTKFYYATAFPIATQLASTWDTTLVKAAGKAIGTEVLEYGVDIILMPALNLHRNPLCGRNFEYYSEDPLVSGWMAAAMIKGLQSNGIGTSIKHFAANNQETNRNSIDTIVSERALRELYLRSFEIAVTQAGPWTVMSSYNKINGLYASESHDLLTKVLRDDWHFKGFVMTDWFGGKDPVAQMKAGNDLLMPGRPEQTSAIVKAVNDGTLPLEVLDTNVKRILDVLLQTPAAKNYKYSDNPDLKAHAQIARTTAAEGMVLLKNQDTVLPFKDVKNIALFGNSSYEFVTGGTGSGDVNEAYSIPLEKALGEAGYVLDDSLKKTYTIYMRETKAKLPKPRNFFAPRPPVPQMPPPIEQIGKLSKSADIALITIGRNSGEFADRKPENDFNLEDAEQQLIDAVSAAFHKTGRKVVVVLNIGGVIETASWRDKADAILLAWQPGQEGGYPVSDILTGAVNPSGKLASTFPVDYKDTPSAKNFPGSPPDKPDSVIYEEGIYVGYRYFTTFDVKPAFEFGFGLSYTRFTYSDPVIPETYSDPLPVKITITNSGTTPGKEIVQLYLSAPDGKLEKPAVELRAFAKTKLLQPGESQVITFILCQRDIASFDTQRTAWIAEKGKYRVKIGASSLDIRQEGKFRLPKELIVEELTKSLSPRVAIYELKK
ncbi:glycoside hydrolase family 3 C-terminal domain-containing protein [candidate division KSB1 bacterium]|nr:glycoside hydrolase family 3 C-terminal domain-containing protein [candidate division KSB1 bacterium]